MNEYPWERREVLRLCMQLCVAGGSLALLEACAPGRFFAMAEESNGKLAVRKSEFDPTPDGKPGRSYVLVKPRGLGFPILLNKKADSTYDAVLLRCTHQGCEVGVEGQDLACPCHGSEFSLAGKVTRGPAQENLHSFETSEDNEYVYIPLR